MDYKSWKYYQYDIVNYETLFAEFTEGRTGGSLARFTDEKNKESRITDIEILFSRITKISTLLSCSYATNSVWRNQNWLRNYENKKETYSFILFLLYKECLTLR